MDTAIFTIEANTRIRDVAQVIHSLEDGFRLDNICVTENGIYVGILEVNRLVNAIAEVNLSLAKGANPLTGLPGNEFIQREITERLTAGHAFSIFYIDIDHFKPFNDHYGFQKGDVVIKALAESVERVVASKENPACFCGHIGGDDFIVISEPIGGRDIASKVIDSFQVYLPAFHGDRDYERKYYYSRNRKGEEEKFELLSLSIAIVSTQVTPVESYAQLASLATEVKKSAKGQQGMSIVENRRGS
jgi:GGDEF domain-containing protein